MTRSDVPGQPAPPPPTRGEFQCRADGELVSGSDEIALMLGYPSWNHLARKATDLRHLLADPIDRSRLDEGVHHVLAGDEARWIRRNGTSVWFLSGVKLLEWSATGEDLLEITVEDVTERRDLEDQLRQGQKMELLGQLTGGVIHDFNNILATILTHAELLGESVREGRREEALDDIEQLRRSAERGAHMVRHLLVFSRPEDFVRDPISVTEVLKETAGLLRRLLPQSIEIELEEAEEDLYALADPGALEQILLNLATNARDAMPRGGRLHLEVVRTTLDRRHLNQHGWGQPGEYTSIIITDTGVGMDPEVMSRVFEPFFTTKEKGKGTGLGLPMVYGLMKQHRGFVEVTAAPEGGTRVCLYFRPAHPGAPVGEKAGPGSAAGGMEGGADDTVAPRRIAAGNGEGQKPVTTDAAGGPRTVLLVEDDQALQDVMARSLVRSGFHVLTALDGHQALDLLDAGEDPALIIADVIMPGMGGVELQKILATSGTAPPILLTSGLDASRAFQGNPIPADVPFLQKPWTIRQLQERVEEVLQGYQKGG